MSEVINLAKAIQDKSEELGYNYPSVIIAQSIHENWIASEKSVENYFDIISDEKYSNLKNAISSQDYLHLIVEDGYTDEDNYVEIITDIMNKNGLSVYDMFDDSEINKKETVSLDDGSKKVTSAGYKVRITIPLINIRLGAGTEFSVNGTASFDQIYSIAEEKVGSDGNTWGLLSNGSGWILLIYTEKID